MVKILLGFIIFFQVNFLFASEYNPNQFKLWVDEDQDCQDTRAETMIRYNTGVPGFKSDSRCKIMTGAWICPYTGNYYFIAFDLEVDHVVPLRHAWDTGADSWTEEKKKQFANDPDNLIVVSKDEKKRKGSRGITEWLPENDVFHKAYISKFMYIKEKYGLKMSYDELELLK